MKSKKIVFAFVALALLVTTGFEVFASSHREAPMISGDPKVDATDLYAFVSPDDKNTVTLIANYIPFEEPAGGPNFDSFDEKAMYEIKIDNDGDAKEDITYQFKFKNIVENKNTFLYNTGAVESLNDADLNVKQTYTVTRIEDGESTVLGSNLKSPPVNIGPKSTPNYSSLQAAAVYDLQGGGKVFAGQSDDPFFVDLGSTFDLLTIRKLPGNMGGGINTTQGSNVHSLALQIPIKDLTKNKDVPTDVKDGDSVIGVWTTASRQATRVLNSNGTQSTSGNWVQVSRLGAPLVNEVVVPLGAKDLFNGSKPQDDAQFANGVTDPEVGKLLKALYNIKVPPQGAFGSADARDDLVAIFLTGIPDVTQPDNVVASEQLRLNVAVPVTSNPNRLGVLGGDNQGYPNGRRLGDDVIDISLRAVAGAAYPLFHPEFKADETGVKLGDGVDQNDKAFRNRFPYMALPNQGFESIPHADTSPTAMSSGSMMSNGNMNSGNSMSKVIGPCNITMSLSMGSTGDEVTCLQAYLIDRGLLRITAPTGYFGTKTEMAVRAWQAASNISVTGRIN